MNNTKLEKVLKKAIVPEPRPGFWDDLPWQVKQGIQRADSLAEANATRQSGPAFRFWKRLTMATALAAACVAMGFYLGAHSQHASRAQAMELAEARACWRQVSEMFPNQVEAIVFDKQGSHLVLSDRANQPASTPIFLKFCDGANCQRFVTFSGQQIQVNGQKFEILLDRQGEVLVVGDAAAWKGSKETTQFGLYSVFAQPLASS
jgi:hypothetical protein